MTSELRRWCEARGRDGLAFFSRETSSALVRGLRLAREHLAMDLAWLCRSDGDQQVIQVLDGDATRFGVFEGYRSGPLTDFCAGVLAGAVPPVAGDAARSYPALVVELGVRSYAVADLPGPDGEPYGLVFCVSALVNDSMRPRDGDTLAMFAQTLAETITTFEARHSVEEAFLRRAEEMLAAGGLRVALQPILELTTGRPIAAEALARFPINSDDTEGWFVDARRAACGVELELDAASAALKLLPAIPAGQRLAINGSPDLLISKHFADLLLDAPMDRLIVEITEHNLSESIDLLAERVGQLQDQGAWVAIDDAGTGYSSLQQILQLGPDIIKLDRLLVTNVDRDPMKRALASAFVTFTREAGVGLIAEGVETAAELAVLETLGVPMAQGYFLARPAVPSQPGDPAEEMPRAPGDAIVPQER